MGTVSPDPTLVRRENEKPGARDWQLSRVRPDRRNGVRTSLVEGYCSSQSVRAGETLRFMVSANPPQTLQIEIFRMGYYGGRGARLMTVLGPLQGTTQPEPEIAERSLTECRWEPTAELTVPEDWPSGVYIGRLGLLPGQNRNTRWQSYVIFVVRDDRPADVLVQCSDNTWQAYNRWPAYNSLYTDPRGHLVADVDVSFDRPFGKHAHLLTDAPQSMGTGEFLLWEFPLSYWLEQQGYDVTYCSNSDMLTPERAELCKAFISVGHDEYWDLRQYSSVKSAIDSGVSALFLSGNAVCFMSPFRDSSDGRPNRIITRAGRYGGMTEIETEYMGPFPVDDGPDEALLMGARTITPYAGGDDWTVAKPEHWAFEGTGMEAGDYIPGLVGWEFHGNPAEIPGLEVVAEGMARNMRDAEGHWTATVYPGPKGNFVFNASTIYWAQGLSSPPGHMLPWSHSVRPHGPDDRVQAITHNLLRRAISGE